MTFEPGQKIGAYRIIRLLGQGGMGAVYEVEHEQLGVRYASLKDAGRLTFAAAKMGSRSYPAFYLPSARRHWNAANTTKVSRRKRGDENMV